MADAPIFVFMSLGFFFFSLPFFEQYPLLLVKTQLVLGAVFWLIVRIPPPVFYFIALNMGIGRACVLKQ